MMKQIYIGNRGKYKRIMDKAAAGLPCPECGTKVEKMAYLGGACYYCPQCQSAAVKSSYGNEDIKHEQ